MFFITCKDIYEYIGLYRVISIAFLTREAILKEGREEGKERGKEVGRKGGAKKEGRKEKLQGLI